MDMTEGLRLPWAVRQQRRHQAEVAARAAGTAGPEAQMTGSAYEAMLACLWADRRRLKEIKSIQGKIEAKRTMLPAYQDYLAGVLEANSGVQDEVVMTLLTWSLDIGDLDRALAIAAYAIGHGLQTPDRFERDTPSLVLEQLAENVLSRFETQPDPLTWPPEAPTPARLVDMTAWALELTRDCDMHDQIRSKGYRAYGYALRADGQPVAALDALRQALSLNDRCGVKKDIERLEREIRHRAPDPAPAAEPMA